MPTDPTATQDPAPQDPIEDNQQADGSQDKAKDNQGSTVDWESQYKELQKRATKAERERDILRQQATDTSDEDEEEPAEEVTEQKPRTRPNNDRVQRDLWNLAEQLYGENAVEAYGRAQRLVERAETPADFIAAFEAYHEARLKGSTPAAAAQAQGEQPPQRRIESNRPDASPDLNQLDQKAEAAKGRGDLRGFLAAQLERAGVR